MKSAPSSPIRPARSPLPHSANSHITHECICKRAHELFLARNGGAGDAVSDWCQAEKELCEACEHTPAQEADPLVVETPGRFARPITARRK